MAQAPGLWAPTTILISPTMRCNLSCAGCFAGEYSPDRDLEPELLQSIVEQANEMGVYFFTILGGEPFMYDGLLDLAAANQECYFQVYTNGTLLDEGVVDELAELGNVAPMLSLEGDEATTDARRGKGVYRHLLEMMDLLGDRGVLYGYSATVTRDNWRMLVSDEWVDPLVARGAVISWHFLYMPIGRDPSTAPMLNAEERNAFREGIWRIRDTKPIFPVDFWGDAPYVKGCIAGKHYMHIDSEGWVEPCIFTHFATDNIRDTSLEGRLQLAVLPRDPQPPAVQPQPLQAVHAHRQAGAVARDHGADRRPADAPRGGEPLHGAEPRPRRVRDRGRARVRSGVELLRRRSTTAAATRTAGAPPRAPAATRRGMATPSVYADASLERGAGAERRRPGRPRLGLGRRPRRPGGGPRRHGGIAGAPGPKSG